MRGRQRQHLPRPARSLGLPWDTGGDTETDRTCHPPTPMGQAVREGWWAAGAGRGDDWETWELGEGLLGREHRRWEGEGKEG